MTETNTILTEIMKLKKQTNNKINAIRTRITDAPDGFLRISKRLNKYQYFRIRNKGDTIGIIEAMKIMNEVEAEFDCRIIKSLVEDGQPVEYAMSLFEVEKL